MPEKGKTGRGAGECGEKPAGSGGGLLRQEFGSLAGRDGTGGRCGGAIVSPAGGRRGRLLKAVGQGMAPEVHRQTEGGDEQGNAQPEEQNSCFHLICLSRGAVQTSASTFAKG